MLLGDSLLSNAAMSLNQLSLSNFSSLIPFISCSCLNLSSLFSFSSSISLVHSSFKFTGKAHLEQKFIPMLIDSEHLLQIMLFNLYNNLYFFHQLSLLKTIGVSEMEKELEKQVKSVDVKNKPKNEFSIYLIGKSSH